MAPKKQNSQKSSKTSDGFFQKPSLSNSEQGKSSDDFFVRSSQSTSKQGRVKKLFDKNKWRKQKYSIKHKLESWEDKRKKAIMRTYHKERRQYEGNKFDVNKVYEEEEKRTEVDKKNDDQKRGGSSFRSIHQQFLDKQEEKKRKKEEMLRIKAEKEEAMKRYKQKKMEKYKKLNKKTNKGQPVMKERLEYLLEKIQQSIDK